MNLVTYALGKIGARRSGQTLVMFALMVTALMGFVALVVDVGFVYSGRRFMQNSADAGSMAGARQLAKNLTPIGSGGAFGFVTTDSDVRSKVQEYLQANRGLTGLGPAATIQLIEYLATDGTTVLGISPTANSKVPLNTAQVRVTTQAKYNSFFAKILNPSLNQSTVSARATAAISPVTKPRSVPGPTWPITRWDQNIASADGTSCANPVEFWSANPPGPGTGSWKRLLWLGRASAFVKSPATTVAPLQHTQLLTKFAPEAGPNPYYNVGPADLTGVDVQSQLEYWFANGWKGELKFGTYLNPATTADGEPNGWTIDGPYSDKAELSAANLGNNISLNIRKYINANPSGTDSCGGRYIYMSVYLWNSNSSEKWNATTKKFERTTGSQVDRISFSDRRLFKFYCNTAEGSPCGSSKSFPSASNIFGYPVQEVYADVPPTSGPPNSTTGANTVHLVE